VRNDKIKNPKLKNSDLLDCVRLDFEFWI